MPDDAPVPSALGLRDGGPVSTTIPKIGGSTVQLFVFAIVKAAAFAKDSFG